MHDYFLTTNFKMPYAQYGEIDKKVLETKYYWQNFYKKSKGLQVRFINRTR